MRGLTFLELGKILKVIENKHRLIEGAGIKYVDLSFDFRTMDFWRIKLRPFGKEAEFSTANRFEECKYDSLYDEVSDWLNAKETK